MDDQRVANIVRAPQVLGRMESIINIAVPNRVVEPRQAATSTSSSAGSTSSCGANACEKSVSSTTFTMPIILGIA
jgi:hypothetical protein